MIWNKSEFYDNISDYFKFLITGKNYLSIIFTFKDDENKKREAEDSEEERQSDEEKEQLETGTNESADKRKKKQSKRVWNILLPHI